MLTTNDFLNVLSARHGRASDYRLAKLLRTSSAALSAYRKGRRGFGDRFCVRVADLLEWPLEYVLACIHHERHRRQDASVELLDTWARIASKYRPRRSTTNAHDHPNP